MGINMQDSGDLYMGIKEHVGHDIVCVVYGDGVNVAIECETCSLVLFDADKPEQGTYRVEWHPSYSGGDTNEVGNFADVETNAGESVEHAFERVVGKNRMHIIDYEHIDSAADDHDAADEDEECSLCGAGDAESTFCGSFCGSCLADHMEDCAECRKDYGLGGDEDDEE